MVDALRKSRLPVVRNSGVQPWVYIDDAAAATAAALERGEPGAAYNIADDEPVSLATMVTAMAEPGRGPSGPAAEPVANRGELTAVIAVPSESGRVLYPAR